MELQSTAVSNDVRTPGTVAFGVVKSLLDCVEKGLLVAERSGRIVLANLRGRETLAALGHGDFQEANLLSDVLKVSTETFVQKLEAGRRELQLEIISGASKYFASVQWMAEPEWLVLQFEQAAASTAPDAATPVEGPAPSHRWIIAYPKPRAAALRFEG